MDTGIPNNISYIILVIEPYVFLCHVRFSSSFFILNLTLNDRMTAILVGRFLLNLQNASVRIKHANTSWEATSGSTLRFDAGSHEERSNAFANSLSFAPSTIAEVDDFVPPDSNKDMATSAPSL